MKSGITYTQLLFRICVECNVSTLNTNLSKVELIKLGKQVKILYSINVMISLLMKLKDRRVK